MKSAQGTISPDSSWVWRATALGAVAGLASGFFGIGGGILIVPGLVFFLGMDTRLAVGTSLAAIIPAAIGGAFGYAIQGSVSWFAAIALVIGGVLGAQLGTRLLAHLPTQLVRWTFIAFIVLVMASLFIVIPSRHSTIDIDLLSGLGLLFLGLVTGALSGLLGVGGGAVYVPVLIVLFGASDLMAKGTSLFAMIPAALSGTVGNFLRRNVDFHTAAVVGLAATVLVVPGVMLAALVTPAVANVLFIGLLAVMAVRMAWKN